MTRKTPNQFPATPEHPEIKPELREFLNFVRAAHYAAEKLMKIGEQNCTDRMAFRAAGKRFGEVLLKFTRREVDSIGPGTDYAQRAVYNEFVRSLEQQQNEEEP